MEHMPGPQSPAVSHWAVCPNEKDFRKKKEPQPCRPEDSQPQLFASPPPQPSVNDVMKRTVDRSMREEQDGGAETTAGE